jgi:hypothetical protein
MRESYKGWINAKSLIPDSDRVVIVIAVNKHGRPKSMQARYSDGWRFLEPANITRREERVRVWMDIPWWDKNEQSTQSQATTPRPSGTKIRPQGEADTQELIWPDWRGSFKETWLAPEEMNFEDQT